MCVCMYCNVFVYVSVYVCVCTVQYVSNIHSINAYFLHSYICMHTYIHKYMHIYTINISE